MSEDARTVELAIPRSLTLHTVQEPPQRQRRESTDYEDLYADPTPNVSGNAVVKSELMLFLKDLPTRPRRSTRNLYASGNAVVKSELMPFSKDLPTRPRRSTRKALVPLSGVVVSKRQKKKVNVRTELAPMEQKTTHPVSKVSDDTAQALAEITSRRMKERSKRNKKPTTTIISRDSAAITKRHHTTYEVRHDGSLSYSSKTITSKMKNQPVQSAYSPTLDTITLSNSEPDVEVTCMPGRPPETSRKVTAKCYDRKAGNMHHARCVSKRSLATDAKTAWDEPYTVAGASSPRCKVDNRGAVPKEQADSVAMDPKVIRERKRKNGRTEERKSDPDTDSPDANGRLWTATIDFIVQGIPQTASETLMENSDKRSLFTDESAGSVGKYYAIVSAMVIRRNPPSLHRVTTLSDPDLSGATYDRNAVPEESHSSLGRMEEVSHVTWWHGVRNRDAVGTNTSSLGYISFSSSLIMSAISDILALAQPLADDDPKTLAQKELDAAYERVDALVRTRPDDKEMLAEDQETWVGVWEQSLVHGIVMGTQREERERVEQEPANSVAKGVTAEEVRGDEDGSGKVDEDANAKDDAGNDAPAPPTRESTTSGEGSRTSGGMRAYVQVPARAKRSRIVLDDDDEDEEDVDPRPVKKTSGSPPTVTHKVPCKACAGRSETCRGPEGRTCFVCTRLKIKCDKSPGRTRAQKAAEDEAATDKKGKGKVAARPTRVRQEVEDPIELVDTEEEELPKKVPRTKTQPKAQVTDPVHDAGVRAVKRLEAKILKNQARMKAAEADMADMGAEVDSQRVELDAIKKALGIK
ncbi:hypothetical protein L210DRAFT_3501016 [Boletus edulis BED1]|uniref:Zn(2)-C6 fungal-type domain-containing protein n=1 Tax=Boletus edulis BED1 TaxID=1328754 RepID=A0AAD4C429_BOLED|nr:hypothetical protein L210DRAFT_3501016 [Boletus edulis BED1]